jgi:hypothetical protein
MESKYGVTIAIETLRNSNTLIEEKSWEKVEEDEICVRYVNAEWDCDWGRWNCVSEIFVREIFVREICVRVQIANWDASEICVREICVFGINYFLKIIKS